MPGLTGIIGDCFSPQLIERMIQCMCHEAFYKVSKYVDHSSRIGVAAIGPDFPSLDQQPIFNEDGGIWAIMQGEIYNRKELKNDLSSTDLHHKVSSDVELLIHLYEKKGIPFLKLVKGQFVIFIYDAAKQRALIGNDRYGFMPLYYACPEGALLFSCEVKSILEYENLDRSLDRQSINDFFHYETILDHRTFFKAISHLPPGKMLLFQDNKAELISYWNPQTLLTVNTLNFEDFIETGEQILERSVGECFAGNNVGLSLTGGWDTRAILAASDPSKKITCFTLTGPFRDCLDTRIAALVAKLCKLQHHTLKIPDDFIENFAEHAQRCVFISDGMASITRAHEIPLNAKARNYCDIRVTGEGASQIARGTSLFRDRLPASSFFSADFQRQLESTQNSLGDFLLRTLQGKRINRKEILTFILEHELRQGARAGNRMLELSQVWIRTPYTHEDFIEHMFKSPDTYQVEEALERMKHRSTKDRLWYKFKELFRPLPSPPLHRYIIEKNRPDLTQIPVNLCEEPFSWTGWRGRVKRLYTLPLGMLDSFYEFYDFPGRLACIDRVVRASKLAQLWTGFQQYVHYRQWLSGPLCEYVRTILLDPRTLNRGYFDRNHLQQAVYDHMLGRACYSTEFARFITFELWHRQFTD